MADEPPPSHDAPHGPPPMPRWLKGLLAAGLALLVLFVALHVAGLSPVGH